MAIFIQYFCDGVESLVIFILLLAVFAVCFLLWDDILDDNDFR